MTARPEPDRGETSRPRFLPGVRLRFDERRQQWVVLAPETVLVPDEVAVEVLKLCTGERSLAAIVDDLARMFDAPRDDIERDVSELLGHLKDRQILEL